MESNDLNREQVQVYGGTSVPLSAQHYIVRHMMATAVAAAAASSVSPQILLNDKNIGFNQDLRLLVSEPHGYVAHISNLNFTHCC